MLCGLLLLQDLVRHEMQSTFQNTLCIHGFISHTVTKRQECLHSRLKWNAGQSDFKLVLFIYIFLGSDYNTKEKQIYKACLKSFWTEIHFNLQHLYF